MKQIKLEAFDYPPFYINENGHISGIAADINEELYKRLGIETELAMHPLARSLYNLETGTSDAMLILIKTPEREAFLNFSIPVIEVRGLIWSLKDKGPVRFSEIADLSEYRIGATLGYSYGSEMDALLKKTNNISYARTDLLNYRKLLAQRTDIFPGNEIVAKWIFKTNKEFQGEFVHSENEFITWKLHLAVSKKSPLSSRMEKINSILNQLKDSGFIQNAIKDHIDS